MVLKGCRPKESDEQLYLGLPASEAEQLSYTHDQADCCRARSPSHRRVAVDVAKPIGSCCRLLPLFAKHVAIEQGVAATWKARGRPHMVANELRMTIVLRARSKIHAESRVESARRLGSEYGFVVADVGEV